MFLFKNEYQFYENAPVGRYRLEGQFDTATTLTPQLTMLENRSISKYRFNTLIFFGYKSKRDKISLTLFSNRLTTKTTQIQDGIYPAANPNYRYATSSLLYDIEGGLGPHLKGKHLIARQNHEPTWDFFTRRGYNDQHNNRYLSSAYTVDSLGNKTSFSSDSIAQTPTHYFRNAGYNNFGGGINVKFVFPKSKIVENIKTGISCLNRIQNQSELQYRWHTEGITYNGMPSNLFSNDNKLTWNSNTNQVSSGLYIYNNYDSTNSYRGNEIVLALYAMTNFSPVEKLQFSVGLRGEMTMVSFLDRFPYYKSRYKDNQ